MVHQCQVPWSDHFGMPHGPSVWGTVIWSLQFATWSISVRYLDLITPVCHMVCQCEVPWSDHSSNIGWAVQIMKLVMHFFFLWSLLFHLRPKSLPQCHILVCCLCPSYQVRAQVTCPYKRSKMTCMQGVSKWWSQDSLGGGGLLFIGMWYISVLILSVSDYHLFEVLMTVRKLQFCSSWRDRTLTLFHVDSSFGICGRQISTVTGCSPSTFALLWPCHATSLHIGLSLCAERSFTVYRQSHYMRDLALI